MKRRAKVLQIKELFLGAINGHIYHNKICILTKIFSKMLLIFQVSCYENCSTFAAIVAARVTATVAATVAARVAATVTATFAAIVAARVTATVAATFAATFAATVAARVAAIVAATFATIVTTNQICNMLESACLKLAFEHLMYDSLIN